MVFLAISQAYSFVDYSVVLKNISSSGRTLTLDRGQFANIGNDDFAFLVEKKSIDKDKFIYRPIAKLKIIKLLDRESIWIAYKVYHPSSLIKGTKHYLLSETALLQGRNSLKISQMDLVTSGDVNSEVQDFLLEGDDLSKRSSSYKVIETPHKTEKHFDNDGHLVDINKWKSKLGDNKYYVSGVYKGPKASEFSDRMRYRTFEKMVISFLEKYNDPTFDRTKLYGEDSKLGDNFFAQKSMFLTARDKYEERLITQAAREEKFYKFVKKRGKRWSEDYSDAELSEILNNLSVIRELQRRRNLIALKFKFQGFIGLSVNMLNNDNLNDIETAQSERYDFEIGGEGYLFDELERFQYLTTEFSIRSAKDGFYGGTLNVLSQEYSVATFVNWYPFKRPSSLKVNVIYFGVGLRLGFSTLKNNTFDEIGNYQLSSFPAFHMGLKYHLDSGYGVRLTFGYENINVDRIKKEFDNGSLPDRASYKEAKLGLSLSKFF